METKTFEVLDSATFIPVLAIKLDPDTPKDRYLLSRAGFGNTPGDYILLLSLSGGKWCFNFEFFDRTYQVAHTYIKQHWFSLCSGEVLDVEFILGETKQPKPSEQI